MRSSHSRAEPLRPLGSLRLFHGLILRPLLLVPSLAVLKIFSVALGVAVFCSIQIANDGANTAFRSTVHLVTGNADLEIRGRIPEAVFPEVARVPGVREATPLVEWIATIPGEPGEYLRVVGIDPFSGESVRPFELAAPDGGAPDLEAWLADPAAFAAFPSYFERRGQDSIPLSTPSGTRSFTPRFVLLPFDKSDPENPRFLATDIGWAQEFGDSVGFLTSIAIRLEPEADLEATRSSIQALLPEDLPVRTPAGRTRQTEAMLASFQLNLTALSMVSLLVGCYLIYNAVAASVIRRRVDIGILRATGASGGFLRGIFLIEAGVCGAVGGVIGVLLSLPLAAVLTGHVAATISSLYVLTSVESVVLSPATALVGLLVGMAASLAAAWFPASEATRVDPREVLHPGSLLEKSRVIVLPRLAQGGLLLLLAALSGWAALFSGMGPLGFVSAFLVIAGFSLCAPAVAAVTVRLLRPVLLPLSVNMAIGLQNLSRSLFRNSITTAALAAAVAMLVGISVMIFSFRVSVSDWMDKTLVADLFIAPAANEIAGLQIFLPEDFVDWVAGFAGIRETATFREVPVHFRDTTVSMGVFSGAARGELEFLEGDSAARSLALEQPDRIAVTESLARRFGIVAGETVELPFPGGSQILEVVGTYRDYTRDAGMFLLSRENFERYGGDGRVHSMAVFLEDSTRADAITEALRSSLPDDAPPLSIYANAALKSRVGEIFDQTFAVTSVLRSIAVVVAIGGVLLGLGALVRERSREIATLRAIGASRLQVFQTVLAEAGAIGLLASLLGILSGACLALVLTFVINKAFFGWTVQLSYPWDFLLWTPLWVTATALIAAVWPALRAANTAPASALRSE